MKNTLKKRLISLFLTLSVLSVSSLFAFAQDDLVIDSSDNAILNDLTTDEEDDYTLRYVEDEVIIMLADTPETENLQLYSVYSDDYQTLNLEATEKANASRSAYALNSAAETVTVAGSTNAIEDILDLGIEITEMKMLNPQSEEERVNTVSVSRSAADSNTNEKVYTVNEENNNIFSLKFEDSSVGEVIATLNDNPMIEVAEPNYIYELQAIQYDPEQYALEHIEALDAWTSSSGANVAVGIIDTGIEGTHPALENNLWENPYYTEGLGCSVCSRSDDIYGYNFTGIGSETGLSCGGIPTDINGHGTHVSGIVAANSGVGTDPCGVAHNAKLVWLGCSSGGNGISNDAVIEAVNYADMHNIPIVNASYSSLSYSAILEQTISNYFGLFVAAAGNVGQEIYFDYPACYNCPNIITVAASNEQYQLTDYSNYGSYYVDVVAPGHQILSSYLDGTYAKLDGTSMAAPHVAGIAALIKSLRTTYSTQEIKAAICGTIQESGADYPVKYGDGLVSAADAVLVYPGRLKSVTFNYNYSGAPTPFVDYVINGKRIYAPNSDPVREGYIFTGWSTSATSYEKYNFLTPVSADITLYAHWNTVIPGSYAEEFPDSGFRGRVLFALNQKDSVQRNNNDIVSSADFELMTTIDTLHVGGVNAKNLSGIENFTGLTHLYCNYNNLSSLDLRGLTSLQYLNCSNNALISLKIDGLASLETLSCSNNLLTILDVSGLNSLTSLTVYGNDLNSISDILCLNDNNGDLSITYNSQHKWYASPYIDVSNVTENFKAIQYVYENGLMTGTTSTTFSPNQVLSRGRLAFILYNMAGNPSVAGLSNPFTDVSSSSYYYDAVKWAYNNGNTSIMSGTSATIFNPSGELNRKMVAVIFDKYAQRNNVTLANIRNYCTFADEDDISSWAKDSVQKLYKACLMNVETEASDGSLYFMPDEAFTREDTAVLIRLFEVCRLYL